MSTKNVISKPDVNSIDSALSRAIVTRFLSLGFAPPTKELLSIITDPQEQLALNEALEYLDLPVFHCDARLEELEESFTILFGHTIQGLVCPYETEYGNLQVFQQGQELADIQGFYNAIGLKRKEDSRERADHIGMECEYLSILARKEAYLMEDGDEEQLNETRQIYRLFLRDHLARFGIAVNHRLERENQDGFYGRLGFLCRSFLELECVRLNVSPGLETLPLRSTESHDEPMVCGGCEEDNS